MDLSAMEETSLGLAHALFRGVPVSQSTSEALKRVLQGVLVIRY